MTTADIASSEKLLTAEDPEPFGLINGEGRSPFLLLCDHAGNSVPRALGRLGVDQEELDRHIGIDIGAFAIAERLAGLLDAPLCFQRYSRLVIDVNRQTHAPDSIPPVSDGTSVPANENLSENDRRQRIDEILIPYHSAVEAVLDARRNAGRETVIVSVHTFTPRLRARPADRPWPVAVMWADNDRFGRSVLGALNEEPGMNVGVNEPYAVNMGGDYSIPIHAEGRGLDYVEFEVRQDLVGETAGARAWAERLARVVTLGYERLPRA